MQYKSQKTWCKIKTPKSAVTGSVSLSVTRQCDKLKQITPERFSSNGINIMYTLSPSLVCKYTQDAKLKRGL